MEVEEEEEDDKPLALRKDPNFRVDFDDRDGEWKVYLGGQRIPASSLASSDGSSGSFPGGLLLAPGPSAGIRFGNVLT